MEVIMKKLVFGDPVKCLRKARDLLTDETWIQGAMAKDARRRLISPTSPEAVYWSAEGAIRRFCDDSLGTAILAIVGVEITLQKLEHKKVRLSAWNDAPGRTVCEVRKMLLASA